MAERNIIAKHTQNAEVPTQNAERPAYYAIIPASVRYDKRVTPNAKVLYGEITALCNDKGFCWASNNYFADLYEVTPQAISKWIKSLSDCGYVSLEYEHNGREIKTRKIYIKEVSTQGLGVSTKDEKGINKRLKGYQQKIKENNTSKNNKSNNKESNVFEDDVYRLATLLSELHIQNIDKGFKPLSKSQRDRWAKDIDKLHRIDGRSYQDIEKAIRTIKKNGQFWGTVVMSGSKLREKFPTIWAQINQAGYNKSLPVHNRDTMLDLD